MSIDFPTAPDNGDRHTHGNVTYVWDSNKGCWYVQGALGTDGSDYWPNFRDGTDTNDSYLHPSFYEPVIADNHAVNNFVNIFFHDAWSPSWPPTDNSDPATRCGTFAVRHRGAAGTNLGGATLTVDALPQDYINDPELPADTSLDYKFTGPTEAQVNSSVLRQLEGDARYLQLTGGTLTGNLNLDGGRILFSPIGDATPANMWTYASATAGNDIIAFSLDGAEAARIDAPEDQMPVGSSIATRDTGDARYLQLAGGVVGGTLSLSTTDSTSLRFDRADATSGLAWSLGMYPESDYIVIRSTQDGSAWATQLALHPNSSDTQSATRIVSQEYGDNRYVRQEEFHTNDTGGVSWRTTGNTLECWGRASTDAVTGIATISLPKTFVNTPRVRASMFVADSVSTAEARIAMVNSSLTNTNTVSVMARRDNGSGWGVPWAMTVEWHAIGEWNGVLVSHQTVDEEPED